MMSWSQVPGAEYLALEALPGERVLGASIARERRALCQRAHLQAGLRALAVKLQ